MQNLEFRISKSEIRNPEIRDLKFEISDLKFEMVFTHG